MPAFLVPGEPTMADDAHDDHISDLVDVLSDVLASGDDDTLCASFNVPDAETPWVQVIPGTLNTFWPHDETDPVARLREVVPAIPDGVELEEVVANQSATFAFPEDCSAHDWAMVVDQLFRGLYGLPEEYDVEVEMFALALAIPEPVPIAREEGHTNRIGTCDGGQFMGFVVATLPSPAPENWQAAKTWYAVLHRFDAEGEHTGTQAEAFGTTADGEDEVIERASARVDEWIAALANVEFGDVAVNLFEVEVDGSEFGLVDTTWEADDDEELFVQATLVPNDLVFQEPWDGTYDT